MTVTDDLTGDGGVSEGTASDPRRLRNRPPPLDGFDPLACDPTLAAAVRRSAGADAVENLGPLARLAGSARAREHARLAREHPPRLHPGHAEAGQPDDVKFHPSWHWLLEHAVSFGLHSSSWERDGKPGAHVGRAAAFYLWSQAEAGHGSPVSMTHAAVPVLRQAPELTERYEPALLSRTYQPDTQPPATKSGLLVGMPATEPQDSANVRTRSTTAQATSDGAYQLTGHKQFAAAPTSDLFLTLAQAPDGVTCFLVPRLLPDGSSNGIRVHQPLGAPGNHANAAGNVEYAGALGHRVGEEGSGLVAVREVVATTRLDSVLASASAVRLALSEAIHHARHRHVSDGPLLEQPLLTSVLADLTLESEGATALAMRLAAARDAADPRDGGAGDDQAAALLHLMLPMARYYVRKRAPSAITEALDCLADSGAAEEPGMLRLNREMPLPPLWGDSGNVTSLDALRTLQRRPETAEALLAELDQVHGVDARYDAALSQLRDELAAPEESRARRVAELAASCLQGSLLLRYGPGEVADAFAAARLGEGASRTFGVLPRTVDPAPIVHRVTPQEA